MLFYLTAVLIASVDQLIKSIVVKHLMLGQSIKIVGNFLQLTYVRNTGAAFSLFVGFSSYLAIVGVLVSCVVIYFHHRLPAKNTLIQVGLAFVLGGSLGNLADRLTRFYVVDYIDVLVWPVFNLADIMINFGVLLIAYKLLATPERKNVSSST